MTDDERAQHMARLRAENTMSPEESRAFAEQLAAAEAKARAARGGEDLQEGDVSRTKWAEPNHFRVVRPAPDEPEPDGGRR